MVNKRRTGKKKEEELAKRYREALSAYCNGDYNVLSCINLAFVEAVRSISSEEFKLPQFSREAVLQIYSKPPSDDAQSTVRTYVDMLYQAATSAFRPVYKFEFSLDTRLTVHTRWPYLPLEIGLAWHPIFNIPYIPASSIKGALRAAFPDRVCGLEKTALFGTTSEESILVIFDAYPIRWEKVMEPDVITPHYKEISGEIHETSADPTPLVFPTVPPGTTFAFIVGMRRGEPAQQCDVELFQAIKNALKNGIGAKTTLGYGIFK